MRDDDDKTNISEQSGNAAQRHHTQAVTQLILRGIKTTR